VVEKVSSRLLIVAVADPSERVRTAVLQVSDVAAGLSERVRTVVFQVSFNLLLVVFRVVAWKDHGDMRGVLVRK
jgi:hypothetical protein